MKRAEKYGNEELERIGNALYGTRWQTDLSRALGLSDARRIRQWLSDDRRIPVGVWDDLASLLRQRKTSIDTILKDLHVEKCGNEAIDATDAYVYTMAAAHHPHVRVHQIGCGKWDELLAQRQDAAPTPTKPAQEPEHRHFAAHWIKDLTDWINRRR